jgi:hypothetical protein
MDETTYFKSKDAGNYRFNPFCDAVEIFLNSRDKDKSLNHDIKVAGDISRLQVTFKKYQPQNWSSN